MGRAAAVLALAAALVAWFEIAPHVSDWTLWPSILLVALVLIPATFLLVWLALPLWQWPWLLPAGAGFLLLGVGLSRLDLPVGSNFCKLGRADVLRLVVPPLLRGAFVGRARGRADPVGRRVLGMARPDEADHRGHAEVFGALSIAFVVPGGGSARLGLPDLLFFAVFLAAAVRFDLRPFATWVGLVAGLSLTMICATWWDVSGLPALPGLSLGFLIPNADLLWRRLGPARARTTG